MAGYMNFTLSRAPNENWVDDGRPDCFYRSNCQELFYESFCFRFYRSNLKKGFTKASFPAIQIFFQRVPWPRREFHTCTLVIMGKNLFHILLLCQNLNQTNRHIFALRLLFVIVFEHFVFGVCKMIDFGVPDIPESLDIKVGTIFVDWQNHQITFNWSGIKPISIFAMLPPTQIKREKFLAKRALQDMVEARPAKTEAT